MNGEEYGFRWGAFLASIACLAAGSAMCVSAEATSPLWYGVAAALIAAFILSALGSRFWSDRPALGLRRLAANAQLALLALLVVIIMAWAGYVFASILFGLAIESLWRLPVIILVLILLSLIVRSAGQDRNAVDNPLDLVDVVANAYRQVALHLFR